MFISKPLIVLNFLTIVLILEPFRVHALIQWLRNIGDSLHLNSFKLCVRFLDTLSLFLVPQYPHGTVKLTEHLIITGCSVQKHSLKWEQQTANKTKTTPVSSTKVSFFIWFQLSRVSPYKLVLDLSFLDSHRQLMLSFCKYSFLGTVSASWRCFLFLVGPGSAPRTLLGLSWSSVSIQWTVSHLMSILCAGLTVWTEGPSHFQLVLEAKIASVLGPSKHSTSPNLVSQVGTPLKLLCDNSSHQNSSGEWSSWVLLPDFYTIKIAFHRGENNWHNIYPGRIQDIFP